MSGEELLKIFLKELHEIGIESITENELYYFVRMKPKHYYDHDMYKINKKNNSISFIDLINYLCEFENDTKKVSLEEFRRAMKSSPLEF